MDLFSAPPPASRKSKADRSKTSQPDEQPRKETLGRRSLSAIQRTSIPPLVARSDVKKGYGIPPGLAEEAEQRENVAAFPMTGKGTIRFTTARARPGPAPILAPVSILRRNSNSTNVTATTVRNEREYESDAAKAVRLAFAARFGEQASAASSAQHSGSSSTASSIFPTLARQSVSGQQHGLLLPRDAVGASLRLEVGHPVAFPSPKPPRDSSASSAKQSRGRGVPMETPSPLASPIDPNSTKMAAASRTAAGPELAQLRTAMLNADTREQCINLLDRLLASVDGSARAL